MRVGLTMNANLIGPNLHIIVFRSMKSCV